MLLFSLSPQKLVIVNTTMGAKGTFNATIKSYKANQSKFVQLVDDPNGIALVYTVKDKKNNDESVVATILLLCDGYNMNILKVIKPKNNEMVLFSPHACPIINHPGLSSGSVILILFFTGAAIYLIGGMLILYCIRGARGVEVIPNIDFWKSLPGLVKDGTIFLLSGCRPTFVPTSDSYDRI